MIPFIIYILLVLPFSWGRFGPYSTADPDPTARRHITHPKPISALWDPSLKKPYPTNAWWMNLVVGGGDQTVNTYPYISKAKTDQVCFCLPNYVENKDYVLYTHFDEWCLRIPGGHSHKVVRYDELSVTINYPLGGDTAATFPFVQGSPFIVGEYKDIVPEIVTIAAMLEVKDETGKVYRPEQHPTTAPAQQFTIKMNNGHFWTIYFDSKVELVLAVSSIMAKNKYTGAIKMAGGANEGTVSALEKYSKTYVNGADIDYSVTGVTARIYYRWKVKGQGDVLMLAMPHHLDALIKPIKVEAVTYRTIRGTIVGIEGKEWMFGEILPRYVWDSLTPIDPAKIPEIKKALETDYKYVPQDKDPYFFGIQIGRLGRLALIADQLNENDKAAYIRSTMEKAMVPWLLGTNPDALLYDTTYGGIVSTQGIKDENGDFGNGNYNDHHFHYGYHVFACAVIGRKNPEFLNKYKETILTYARDYANPSEKDPHFIKTRNKDWFGWHSWAAGLYEFGDGRNQESTSEALMAYYGLMLLGEAMRNNEMKDFGRLLLAMELRATKMYWHIPSKSNIYPEVFKQNRMVGVLWANKVDYATFFGKNPIFIHGIQMLPFIPPTEYSLDKDFIREEYEVIKNENTPTDWIPYRVAARSIIDKEAAWGEALGLNEFHSGTCKAIILHWIATRP